MEQKNKKNVNVEGQKFSAMWYEKQSASKNGNKGLNGFASVVLWILAIYQIFPSVIAIVTGTVMMGLNAEIGIVKILGGVMTILISVAIIMIAKMKKVGIYLFFALEMMHVALGGIIGGATADSFGMYAFSAFIQIAMLSGLLLLKKNGKSGWETILGK